MNHLFLLVLSVPLLATADPQCYYPNGLVALDYAYVPCQGTTFSSCCIPSEGDVCLSNGLCYYSKGQYPFRGACTDKTWTSDACPKYCISTNPKVWQALTSCGGDQYCCPTSSSSPGTCCTNSTGVFTVEPGFVNNDFGQVGISVPGTATATSKSSSTTSSTSSSSTFTTSPTSTPAPSSKSNTKAIAIGVSIGVSLLAISVAVLACLCYRRFNKKRSGTALLQEKQQQMSYPSYPSQQQPHNPPQQAYQAYPLQQQQQAMYSPTPTPTPAPPYNLQHGGVGSASMAEADGQPKPLMELDTVAEKK
ncbi:hypothetical protein GP486_004460 [Trichoglossum hirsutum]|uniref:Uncharacterized protein n=1 Tax=Trichoglossum hirsutum TaxID=265104 RepID=A0A9P8LB15_9PEZI|nr:hypothetical protein GP486_004460 [Trichoglossum hirsutum]